MKRLTDCEELVMSVIWDADENLNLPQIVERVNRRYEKDWAMQTVSTFLARLRRKGVVDATRSGRTFFYQVLMPKEDYISMVAKGVCDFWFDGNIKKMTDSVKRSKQ